MLAALALLLIALPTTAAAAPIPDPLGTTLPRYPRTLELLATYDMPQAPDPPGTKAYQNFAGGGYFFLDERDRIWSATKTSHLFVLEVAPDGRSITKVGDYDLTGVLGDDERITSALPDFRGRIWFVSKQNGKVGVLNRRTGRARAIRLGEDIQ